MIKPGTYTFVPVVRKGYIRWRIRRGWRYLCMSDIDPDWPFLLDDEHVEADSPAILTEVLVHAVWVAARVIRKARRAKQLHAAAAAAKHKPIRWP